MTELTLLRQHSPLADPLEQVRQLESTQVVPPFAAHVSRHDLPELQASGLDVLQVNVGRVCNQTCAHCHVDAGPDRRESMSAEVAAACLQVLEWSGAATLDITGGAPEMNPQFRQLVQTARRHGREVIDRCNLTILESPGFQDLPEFLADNHVHIVASLPCYLEENVDRQRGNAVFRRSIAALQHLNELGYGRSASDLQLSLVFNPVGPSLPPQQEKLEADYRRELGSRYGIEFTRLYTITNMPISRFLADLLASGKYEDYMQKLVTAFNPDTVSNVMCRSMLSVDWEGRLFDCDFNQMLNLTLDVRMPQSIFELTCENLPLLLSRSIVTGKHCYGCTAGAGSSCQGSINR